MNTKFIILLIFLSNHILMGHDQHPSLILTKSGLKEIKKKVNKVPLFKSSFISAKEEVDAWMSDGVNVPIPKDMSGGYSHEVHKQNYLMLQAAGNIFQIAGDKKYARHIHAVFKAYADLYPTLDKHPAPRSYARGKLFWQCLNDANWLVSASQAYDCIYNYLTKEERNHLETKLFKPFADYISIENPAFFNRVHNHSTWGNAAVGMIALVMDDAELLDRALYGIKGMGAMVGIDNDGGTIDVNKKAGFYAQLDEAFSPDGYYSEGPYYQRYAMSPFIMFCQALQNVKP
ncbi:MAG: alginate lyase family protein, partial [Saprospiraceae bacterium]